MLFYPTYGKNMQNQKKYVFIKILYRYNYKNL